MGQEEKERNWDRVKSMGPNFFYKVSLSPKKKSNKKNLKRL